VDEKL